MELRSLGTSGLEVSALSAIAALVLVLSACAGEAPAPAASPTPPIGEQHMKSVEVPPAIRAAVDASDRDPADADMWRNADDKRDWNSSPIAAGEKRGTSDRFALKFVKP